MDNDNRRASRRTEVLSNHLLPRPHTTTTLLSPSNCLSYSPPELSSSNPVSFDTSVMRSLLDGHNLDDRDWLFGLIVQSPLFNRQERGGRVFVSVDYNHTMEQQREETMRRIGYLLDRGVFRGWLTGDGPQEELRKLALHEVISMYDHSLAVKIGVHIFLWGGAVKFLGTKRHHDKWLRATENYELKGCFAMTELGHGSNVRGVETVTTYDSRSGEFVINTPCESAQKYWIGGAANHATHTIVFSQLYINGGNQGVHAFICPIRDSSGNVCPNIRIAECGHKIGLNGVDNGRIWFDNVRIPRENLLNSVADVSPRGEYLSSIKNVDQRFAAFLAPLTSGRVTIASSAVYISKIGLSIAIRYALTRRAFSMTPNGPEVLLLDYPSHQQRLLPLLAKIYAMSFAGLELKMMYVNRTPESNKEIHIVSSAYKATFTWNNMRTLQECREACGGQGVKSENRIGPFKGEFDVHSTFEGDNNVLMQQISKALLGEYIVCQTKKQPFRGLGLEHMNNPVPVLPSQLRSSILRSSEFQLDLFHLRERDLLGRFVAEVSQYQAQGESKESAFNLVSPLPCFVNYSFIDSLPYSLYVLPELSSCRGLGQSFLRTSNTENLHRGGVEGASWFIEGCLGSVEVVICLDFCG
ncbi:Acyl-coenzyme A oxidase 3, peroxisomal, variant 2 [Stylosanthes scabra]|uniref:Acyl-coenzyme A oxidase n=1 Tax=Stylosanthes scabra TaxID=79078 RepID=A0ABU6Y2E8_9FABA|nr:Acyl-coenzyme A oxidase 3, peroxisomal, variant 2 [Stylosanthes scabra]